MRNNGLLIGLILVNFLFWGGLLFLGLIYVSRQTLNVSQTDFSKPVIIDRDHPLVQSFISQNDQFNLIVLKLSNPYTANHDKLTFVLSDQNGQILRQLDFSGVNVEADSLVKIQFDPVEKAFAKKYIFEVRSETVDPSKAIRAYATDSNNFVYLVYSSVPILIVVLDMLINIANIFVEPFFGIFYLGILLSLVIWIVTSRFNHA